MEWTQNFENYLSKNFPEILTQLKQIYEQYEQEQKEFTIEKTIYAHKYKGTGKAWIAFLINGKYHFVKPIETFPQGNRVEKRFCFKVKPGDRIVINQEGTKSRDSRKRYIVKDDGSLEEY